MYKMTTAVILHGTCDEQEYFEMDFPSPSNAHWIPWLQQKFLRNGALCQALEMPQPYAPIYSEWAFNFSQLSLGDKAIVVGHSAGGGFILKWLHENPSVQLHKLILVAPWLDIEHTKGDFLQCQLKPELQKRIHEIHVLYSSDDPVEGVSSTKDLILKTYPQARLHSFHDKGHFCLSEMGTDQFEELWEICTA